MSGPVVPDDTVGSVAVVGSGAMGSLFGGLLALDGGREVTLYDVRADVRDARWRKALVNVAYNPVTALSRRPVAVADDPAGRRLLARVVDEFADAHGVAAPANRTLTSLVGLLDAGRRSNPENG